MNGPKYRLEVYLPLLKNPDAQGNRDEQPVELLESTINEILEYFQELGLTLNFGTTGVYKNQPEPQVVVQIDVKLDESGIEWLRVKQREWGEKFEQDKIYILHFPVTEI